EKKTILNPSYWFDKFFKKDRASGRMEASQENLFSKVLNSFKGSKRFDVSKPTAYPNRLALAA
ncbi:MAG: hypothetical protein AABY22_24100, partial [Nanoarchaeota archaeon]